MGVFRTPLGSSAKPHQRPIFVRGQEGIDARDCVDNHAPSNFTSGKRTVWNRAYHQALMAGTSSFRTRATGTPYSEVHYNRPASSASTYSCASSVGPAPRP